MKSPHFSNSKRYPALLSYVVEKTLAGRSEELKERVLGVEVFHRSADYDSNSDTVVRVAAGEVRRRLALVYHESEGEHEIEIALPAGSYVPEFFRLSSLETLLPTLSVEESSYRPISHVSFGKPVRISIPPPLRSTWWKPVALLAVGAIAAGCFGVFLDLRAADRPSSLELFWQPIRASSSPAVICPGAMVRDARSPYGLSIAHKADEYTFTSMATTVTLAELVNVFAKKNTAYLIQPSSSITLTDMREHPIILIGAYNNEWTQRLQSDLRYRFVAEPAREIDDGMSSSTSWIRPPGSPGKQEDDFAVVGRFHSKLTDNLVVIIAGIGANGTEGAAQFVTTPKYLDSLGERLPKGWASKNLEIVLRTKVIEGNTAAPTVEAVYLW